MVVGNCRSVGFSQRGVYGSETRRVTSGCFISAVRF